LYTVLYKEFSQPYVNIKIVSLL